MARKLSKAQQAAADEAWNRSQQTEIGQINFVDGTVYGAGREEPAPVDGIPETCPGCGKRMAVGSGWTIRSEAGTPWQEGHLLCGSCGHETLVSIRARDALREALHQHFVAVSWVKPKKEKKERGAR